MRQRSINFSAAMRDMKNHGTPVKRAALSDEQRSAVIDGWARKAIDAAEKRRRSLARIKNGG